ncbi:RNA binding motif protein 11 isoform X3 [Pygocentrus nattereri]|uniref:RNA binding motif protein 11 isoform X3 n=1 Tax=Pygocentrus nattereri TaxID=42514 RepID=UPI001891B311|nr:RNA binding motif protein 11 isoform X3 [Pygocentrus nattereri]
MLETQRDIDKTVFVSNLHSCVREEILYELFLQAGPVKKVVIPRDREGHQRSFGFVYYKHAEAVPYAIELLDGIWLYGRPISLKYTFVVRTPMDPHRAGNSHQACGAASPHLQNGLAGNRCLLCPLITSIQLCLLLRGSAGLLLLLHPLLPPSGHGWSLDMLRGSLAQRNSLQLVPHRKRTQSTA